MIDRIEGKWFHSFAAVYRHKSISKAAEELGYVQSTLTTHIRLLEQVCGRKLFDRLPRGVEPTEAGEELSRFVNQFLQLGEAMNEALSTQHEPKGTVKLQVLESFCVLYMTSVLAAFFEQFPQVRLELSTGFYKETLDALLERKIQIGIVPKNPEREDVDFLPLIQEELVFAASPALSEQMKAGGLGAEQRIISFGGRCIYQSMAQASMMKEWGAQPHKSLEFASLEMIKQTVAGGLGIALVPEIAVAKELRSGKLVKLQVKERIYVTHGMIVLRDIEHTAAVKALKQTVLAAFPSMKLAK